MSALGIEYVVAVLRRARLPVDHRAGENGVLTRCPACSAEMAFVEGWRGFVCDGGCPASDVATALGARAVAAAHEEAER